MYLVNSDLNLCCQCWSDVPPTPPDWLVNISTSEGDTKYTLYDGSSEECTKWRFLNVHDYYADKDTTYPVAEVGDDSAIQWQNVNVDNNAFDESVFDIPDECTKGCNDLMSINDKIRNGNGNTKSKVGNSNNISADTQPHWLWLQGTSDNGNLGQFHCGM